MHPSGAVQGWLLPEVLAKECSEGTGSPLHPFFPTPAAWHPVQPLPSPAILPVTPHRFLQDPAHAPFLWLWTPGDGCAPALDVSLERLSGAAASPGFSPDRAHPAAAGRGLP